jgi:alkyl hydroperoxide reductase subunit AhpC
MATLLLSPSASEGVSQWEAPIGLGSWLGRRWGMLFSHPDDFVQCDLELDRWITLARRTFDLNGVYPVALAMSDQRLDAGWVTQLTGDTRGIWLSTPNAPDDEQQNGRHLKADILQVRLHSSRRRVVVIIDSNMKRRWSHTYDFPSSVPSPLELAHLAGVLRGQYLHSLSRAA